MESDEVIGEKVLSNEIKQSEVRKLILDIGKKVSAHRHSHCSEHWVVVCGVVHVRLNDDEIILRKGESVGASEGELHELENCGRIPVEIIEVRIGEYFGKDDCEKILNKVEFEEEEFCIGPECGLKKN